jgi:hypothetical protein
VKEFDHCLFSLHIRSLHLNDHFYNPLFPSQNLDTAFYFQLNIFDSGCLVIFRPQALKRVVF